MPLLNVDSLKMYYETLRGKVRAVDDVSFSVEEGEALGLAGESGCGKSSLAYTVLRLLPPNAKILSGQVVLGGVDIYSLSEEEMREQVRWKRISLIPQGAMNSLTPVHKVGDQISEAILTHEDVSKEDAADRAANLLSMVGIDPSRCNQYPHEFSGGMKQRAMTAMALACNPELVIADEPTTALDVIVQAQVHRLLKDLQDRLKLSLILISHDLSVVSEICQKTAIMYAGEIVEYGRTSDIFRDPVHPYTVGLLSAFPNIDEKKRRLSAIPGFPPDLLTPPLGCKFHPRCPIAREICKEMQPRLDQKRKGRLAACHFAGEYRPGGT
ncbi:ABC transporter ATP-binding protein [[Eubacterium] cellulosolvens]